MKKLAVLAVAGLALSACGPTVEEKPLVSLDMPPAERDLPAMGDVVTIKRVMNGQERSATVSYLKEGLLKWETPNGCHGTSRSDDRFAPNLSWNNCNPSAWGTGVNKITDKAGDLWPLKVGNTVAYKYTATNSSGASSPNFRNCEVAATANVQAAGKPYDTYKVVCDERFRERTYYYAPSVKRVVLEINHHKSRNTTEISEFVEAQ